MNSGQTVATPRWITPLQHLPFVTLTVSALVALWQSYRAHRTVRETHPPADIPLPESPPHVSIIVPVRNEEATIDACVASLLAQDYPDFDVTLIDDASTDATPHLLAEWARQDHRVQVHRVNHLPDGWAGKVHALHTGVMRTSAEWLLFTDADTRHAPHTLRLMAGHALAQQADLLSTRTTLMTLSGPLMPLLMPISEILLAHGLTPAEVRDPASPRAFAFGQYILLLREAYLAADGYAAAGIRMTSVDDVALAVHFKQHRQRIELVNGRGLITNRQWTTWKSLRQGWVKSCYGELIRSHMALSTLPGGLAFIAYGLMPFGVLLHALYSGKVLRLSTLLAGIALLAQIDAKRCFDREYDLAILWSLAAPVSWVACGILLLDVARLILTGRGADWKGRRLILFPGVSQRRA
ncbi:MAG: glycosyltransferase [Ktedonobacteraceae bacterium]